MKSVFCAIPLLLLSAEGQAAEGQPLPPAAPDKAAAITEAAKSTTTEKSAPTDENGLAANEAAMIKGVLHINSGSYRIQFSAASAWTIRQMHYHDKLLLSQTGAFQTVVNVKFKPEEGFKDGWRGTGHGHETVDSIKLEVDGKTHDVTEGLKVSGKKFTLLKDSRLGPYKHHAEITLDGERLQEKFRYEVIADDAGVNFMYAFMHCFTNKTAQWLVELADGTNQTGAFTDDTSFTLQKDIRWAALYAPTEGMGAVYSYPQVYKGTSDFTNSFWNRKNDNKLYFRPQQPRGLGQKFGYEVTLQAFEATPETWEKTARDTLAQIEKLRKDESKN